MMSIFEKVLKEVNTPWMMENSKKLMEIELGQTFENYSAAAVFTAKLIKEARLENCEIIDFPADGKTVYQDKCMPIAWRASVGKLTIKKSSVPFDDPVVADYKRHPFHLVKGSVATPPGGLNVRIITESQLFAGEDAKGCLVMLNPFTWPRAKILTPALDLGAIGLVSDFLTVRNDTPHAVQWVTACTEGGNWHVQAGDRPFICFSVSPETGERIRAAASSGAVTAHVDCDGERYESCLPVVTAMIPGRQKKELWILSHLYEPLINDNSSGVVSSIEVARVIKCLVASGEIPPLEFSLRLVFAAEMYGFAAFADKMKKTDVIGAINTDGMGITKNTAVNAQFSPPGTPFFGNYLLEKLVREYQPQTDPAILKIIPYGLYGDDSFLSEPSNGIPTVWFRDTSEWWHNSESKINIVSALTFSRHTALHGAWIAGVLTMNRKSLPDAVTEASMFAKKHLQEEAIHLAEDYVSGKLRIVSDLQKEIHERMEYYLKIEAERLSDFNDICKSELIEKEVDNLKAETVNIIADLKRKLKNISEPEKHIKNDKWFDYAASIVPARAVTGFPYDLVAVPKEERTPLPGAMAYGSLSRVFANMDGKKNLQRLLRESEWEEGQSLEPVKIKKYVTAVSYLTDYGYLKTKFGSSLDKKDLLKALRMAGITKGDLVMVHSGLSSFGRIEGSAETVIDALLESVGPKGTVLFPTFTTSFIYFDGTLNKSQRYRPFDRNNPAQVNVGKIPQSFLKRKGVHRSGHPTHSVAGIGQLAEKCLCAHKETDSPTGENSPLAKLTDLKGKILHLGSDLSATTFLHLLEDKMDLPYLGNAVCRIKDPNGKTRTVLIPKHLPGHRDFYDSGAENSKFFNKAKAYGLEIREVSMGLGKLRVIEAGSLYEIGIRITKEDPNIFLCDKAECAFCSRNKKN